MSNQIKDVIMKKANKLINELVDLVKDDPDYGLSIFLGKNIDDESVMSLHGFAGNPMIVTESIHSTLADQIDAKQFHIVHEYFVLMQSINDYLEENNLMDEFIASVSEIEEAPTLH